MSRVAVATIDLDALKHNLSIVRSYASDSKVLVVIKADAYGHGLIPVAGALSRADGFAVAHHEEALSLRAASVAQRIILLQGFADKRQLAELLEYQIEPVIHSNYQIEILERAKLPNVFPVWLKVDSGMNRLGVSAAEFNTAWQRLNTVQALRGNIQVMSHFANADDKKHPGTDEQIKLFQALTKQCDAEKSLANSAGLMHWPNSQLDWVRPGIMLYGASPFTNEPAAAHHLKPVMTLKSQIIAIKSLRQGDAVGYGHTWHAQADCQMAIVAMGYGDGYPRHIKENTPVLINQQRYSIVGRVSMDMVCVELPVDHGLKIGDEVVFWGEGLPVEVIAAQARTITYELLCQVTPRVRFEYING